MKYEEPKLKDLDKAKLHPTMIHTLYELIDRTRMSEELKELWNEFIYSVNTESELSEDEENDIGNERGKRGSSGLDTESDEEDDMVVEAVFV